MFYSYRIVLKSSGKFPTVIDLHWALLNYVSILLYLQDGWKSNDSEVCPSQKSISNGSQFHYENSLPAIWVANGFRFLGTIEELRFQFIVSQKGLLREKL